MFPNFVSKFVSKFSVSKSAEMFPNLLFTQGEKSKIPFFALMRRKIQSEFFTFEDEEMSEEEVK